MKNYTELLRNINRDIWNFSELKFEEHQSSKTMMDVMEKEGFRVERGVAQMETAFLATYGEGHPMIGILAEFDALSGLSQEADVDYPKPREGISCGHGCGHNLLGVASLGASLKIRDYLREKKCQGTVVLVGCPAEEGGSGKAYLARAGVFNAMDVALTWHPAGGFTVATGSMQANCQAYFKFKGISSHAAASPHLGRSALDAVELMNVGVNYMREHMEPTDRIHYAVLDTGGTSPNVVQNHAQSLYLIRSTDSEKVKKLYDRVIKIAQGAAMMTETTVEVIFDKACSNIISNSVLEQLLYDTMVEIPLPQYSEEEREYAGRFKKTLTPEDIKGELSVMFLDAKSRQEIEQRYQTRALCDFVTPHRHLELAVPGSSDVGDVSHVLPTAQFVGACFVPGTPAHSWQMVAQGTSKIAIKGMIYSADVLAVSAIKLLENPKLVEDARAEYIESTQGKGYQCPIPDDVMPNMNCKKQ